MHVVIERSTMKEGKNLLMYNTLTYLCVTVNEVHARFCYVASTGTKYKSHLCIQ